MYGKLFDQNIAQNIEHGHKDVTRYQCTEDHNSNLVVLRTYRNPCCVGEISLFLSKYQTSLVFITFHHFADTAGEGNQATKGKIGRVFSGFMYNI